MPRIESLIKTASTISLILLQLVTSNQIPVDEYLTDVGPNESIMKSFVEEQSRTWIAPDDKIQPKVDLKLELDKLNFSHISQKWPASKRKLGSVSGISFDNFGNVVIFHRGNHVWDSTTFDLKNIYTKRSEGPISSNTIIAINRETGQLSYAWGSNLFYMPHGLTIDHENNVWITDVALHQVFKFNSNNRTKPELKLGVEFTPGNQLTRFCKPTAVAVLENGEFFVADGYCNARIIKFSRNGDIILSWGHSAFSGVAYNHAPKNFFAVPHALTLANDLGLLCVADRENGRVQCFHVSNGTFHSQYHSGIVGDRLFSVAYAPVNGGQLYVVNGPDDSHHLVLGFVINMKSGAVISKFAPNQTVFQNPHDIIVSPDGSEIYVVQLSPNLVHKFIGIDSIHTKSLDVTTSIPNISVITTNKTTTTTTTTNMEHINSIKSSDIQSSRQLLFILGLFVSFVCITLFAVWIIARRRKLGNNYEPQTDFEYSKLMSRC